jgi:tight adherence protein B
MLLIWSLVAFVVVFAVFAGSIAVGFGYFKQKQKEQIRSMLRKAEESPSQRKQSTLMRPATEVDALSKILAKLKLVDRLELLIEQSGSDWTASKLVILSGIAAALGCFLGARFHFSLNREIAGLIGGPLLGSLPLLLLLQKRSKTLSEFEKQLPDALDFLSRSMRAGHAFSVALEMLSADSPDPLGKAFRRISNDLALGSALEEAFIKLKNTVPSVDVQFFVSSVLLQQETGGNLGEILTKLAYIIRERFRLKGQVQAVSAHGRITGLVLLLMPLGVAAFLMVLNPGYLRALADDPTGRLMIYGAIGGQVVGYFVIQRIIDIKV